jgi:hypothetical protein
VRTLPKPKPYRAAKEAKRRARVLAAKPAPEKVIGDKRKKGPKYKERFEEQY